MLEPWFRCLHIGVIVTTVTGRNRYFFVRHIIMADRSGQVDTTSAFVTVGQVEISQLFSARHCCVSFNRPIDTIQQEANKPVEADYIAGLLVD